MADDQYIPGPSDPSFSGQPPGSPEGPEEAHTTPIPAGPYQTIQNEEGMQPSLVNQAAELAGLHPAIKQMELHHTHAPHVKRLKDYLFEFFMLFLAITLGFFVENKREKMTDKNREKQYIGSLVEDLKADTGKINYMMAYNVNASAGIDTLIRTIYGYKRNDTAATRKMYLYYEYAARDYYSVNYTDRTMSQLKNAGNMRLIEDQKVSDTILNYDDGVKLTTAQGNVLKEKCEKALDYSTNIFDYRYIRVNNSLPVPVYLPEQGYRLLNEDPATLSRYANMLELWKQMINVYIRDNYAQEYKAMSLINYLKKEYHLE